MSRVLVLGPGPMHPGADAGLGAMAALAAAHLRDADVEVIAVSPTPSCPLARFSDRAYAEPLDERSLSAIVAIETPDAIFAAFGGLGALEAALGVTPRTSVLGFPGGRAALSALATSTRSTLGSGSTSSGRCSRIVLEVVFDSAGGHVVVGALESDDLRPLTDAVLRAPPQPGIEIATLVEFAAPALAASGAFGVFSLVFVVRAPASFVLVEVHAGARATSVAAARASAFPLATVAIDVAFGRTLRSLDLPRTAPLQATRTPMLAHDRYPGSLTLGLPAGVGQSLATPLTPAHDAPPGVARLLSARAGSGSVAPRLWVVGAGATTVDHTGGRATWAAASVCVARERGFSVTVVDDDPGSLAGALADSWLVAPPDDAHRLALGDSSRLLVGAAPRAALSAVSLAAIGAEVLDAPIASSDGTATFMQHARMALAHARKIEVLLLSDGEESVVVGTVEYVEPVAVHAGDSTAFFPPQTVLEPELRHAEDTLRARARSSRVRGLLTGTFARTAEGPELLALHSGPSSVEPFVTAATGLRLPEIATHLALGANLASLGLVDFSAPAFVAARESVMPRALLAASGMALDGTKRSIGEAMGIGPTVASAYRKALAGVGFRLQRGASVVLSPSEADASDAVKGARKLYPLGVRLLARGPVTETLRALRVPFEEVTVEAAIAALAAVAGSFAFVTGLDGLSLRSAALAAGAPCFTSPILFHAACAVLEEDVETSARALPRPCAD